MKLGNPTMATGVVPVNRPVTISPPPREGTLTRSAPVFCFHLSMVICMGMASAL